MATQLQADRFTRTLNEFLDETFEHVQGIYLDGGTSLFETLATISPEEASRPVSSKCASIAGQVEHVRFYLAVLARYIRKEEVEKINWADSWHLKTVTPGEWDALKTRLHAQYAAVRELINSLEEWDEDGISGALAIVVHTAYHLGEIRQAMCTVKN
jgi:hypothetical protein